MSDLTERARELTQTAALLAVPDARLIVEGLIAALDAAEARAEAAEALVTTRGEGMDYWKAQTDEWRLRAERAEQAIRDHGAHDGWCRWVSTTRHDVHRACNCWKAPFAEVPA